MSVSVTVAVTVASVVGVEDTPRKARVHVTPSLSPHRTQNHNTTRAQHTAPRPGSKVA